MVYKCSIPGCRSNYTGEEKKYRCFSFPKDESLKKQWLMAIPNDDFSPSQHSKVCEIHFNESDFESEASATDPKTGITITAPLARKRLKKSAIPSLFFSSNGSVSSGKKTLSQSRKQLKSGQSTTVHSRLKWVPAKNSPLKNTSETTSASSRLPENKKEEEAQEMVKRKRKSVTNETSNKKITSSKSNTAHLSNGVQITEKSADEKSQAIEKSGCPKPFPLLDVKEEPLSDEEIPSDTSKNNPENVQITNVKTISSESIAETPSDEENAVKKAEEGYDRNFYLKPLNMEERDKAFADFIASELSDLHPNPALYTRTKQTIIKILTEAHFEQICCGFK